MGRAIAPSEVYRWVEQFTRIASNRHFDPWLLGLRIIKEISNRYYYSSDRLRVLTRDAYSRLCVELAAQGLLPERSSGSSDDSLPSLQALLINPLGPVKSSAGVLPHMAHLLGAGPRQKVVPVEDVVNSLEEDPSIQVIMFCDDFAGTGQQISTQLIDALANSRALRVLCNSRLRQGRPVALGIVLGVSFADALARIRKSGPKWLSVFAHAGDLLQESDRAFTNESSVFPEPEFRDWAKALVVDQVGGSLSPAWPGGFGDLQALVVTADNAPNDTLPAIWRSGLVYGVAWKALFERASSPSG